MEDEYVQCPYEKSHVILKKRFQVHLVRCKKNHRGAGKKTCPFNVTHIVEEIDLDEHVKNCPNRAAFEKYKHQEEQPKVSSGAAAPPETEVQLLQVTENWDDLPPVPSYDPKKYTEQAPVLRLMQGQSKSKKKKFRAQERLRLTGIDND